MKETFVDAQNGDGDGEPQSSLNRDIGLEDSNPDITASKLKRMLGSVQEKELASDSQQQLICKSCRKGSCLLGVHAKYPLIPKYMHFVSLNEKYLQYCLDLVEYRAPNSVLTVCTPAIPCSISVNLISSKKDVMFDNKMEVCRHIRRNTNDSGNFVIQCPSSTGTGQWIATIIDRKQSVRNILNKPLLHHLGAFDSMVNIERVGLIDVKGTNDTGSMNSFALRLGGSSPKKLETETVCSGNQKDGSKSFNKQLFSISNAKSMSLNKSSTASSPNFLQGMLHYKWENGSPCFMYFVDDQREAYVAKVLKVESSDPDNRDLEYIYSFYTRKGGRKAHRTCDISLDDIVGKMKATSSLTLCSSSDHSKLMETEFVLFGADSKYFGETGNLDPIRSKTKAYPNKKVDIFRPKHLLKHKSFAKFGAQSSIPEDFSLDPGEDNKLDKQGSKKILGSSPNFELAAIVINEKVRDYHQERVIGGWGLKFLEKAEVERANTSQEASISSETFQTRCPIYHSDCSRNINVIIPAGFHGGPRTRNGGPSSLTERWRTGGHCDCGGWDTGCALTIFNNQSCEKVSTVTCAEGENKSIDLVIQGTKQSVPSMKMVKIHDGKYQIQFQTSLSALQSFSIGMAMIHSHISKDLANIKQ
ncbi:Dna ligase b [Thalictrum thalictroides]|uniref:Dna ligase b n=1 Tax=Thalictrum thalictroides TaxID=46969 RepID=A0A7J6V298_THATH|nr:Dna ligase b [Thalictrum thalictroides]